MSSHKELLEKHTGELGKLERRSGEQERRQGSQHEEMKSGFKSLTDHIMNHIAENTANQEAEVKKEKEIVEEKLKNIVDNIQKQLNDHTEKHAMEKEWLTKNSNDIDNNFKVAIEKFSAVDKIEKSRQVDEVKEKERVTRLEASTATGLKKLGDETEEIRGVLARNKEDRELLRKDLISCNALINRSVREIREDMETNSANDKAEEEEQEEIKMELAAQIKYNRAHQQKVDAEIRSLMENKVVVHKNLEDIKTDISQEEATRQKEELLLHERLEEEKQEQEKQGRQLGRLERHIQEVEERGHVGLRGLEEMLQRSNEMGRVVQQGLEEKLEGLREHVGQSQRTLRASIREECGVVAQEGRASVGEVK